MQQRPFTLYRYLTGQPGLVFNRRVTAALNDGWQLQGAPTLHRDGATGQVLCGQPIIKVTDNPSDHDVQILVEGRSPDDIGGGDDQT